jgi:hypothetical protein
VLAARSVPLATASDIRDHDRIGAPAMTSFEVRLPQRTLAVRGAAA